MAATSTSSYRPGGARATGPSCAQWDHGPKYDDLPATHVLCDSNLPPGEMVQLHGYLIVPPALAAELGEPDTTLQIGGRGFAAWRMDGEMPPAIRDRDAT